MRNQGDVFKDEDQNEWFYQKYENKIDEKE